VLPGNDPRDDPGPTRLSSGGTRVGPGTHGTQRPTRREKPSTRRRGSDLPRRQRADHPGRPEPGGHRRRRRTQRH